MDIAAKVIALNLNADDALNVWELLNQIQHDTDFDAAWVEYCRIEELAELRRVNRELGVAQDANWHHMAELRRVKAELESIAEHRDHLQREATKYAEALGETRYELSVAIGQRNELQAKFETAE